MEVPHSRLIVFIILGTIILSVFLSVLIPLSQSRNHTNLVSGWTAVVLSTLTVTPSPEASTPLPATPFLLSTGTGTATLLATPKTNCTHTALYWVYHIDLWPAQFGLGRLIYTKAEALETLQAPYTDVSNLLFLQFTAAYLNVLSGADATTIGGVLMQAADWLYANPPGGKILDLEAGRVSQMARSLEEYNVGDQGPGGCIEESSVEAYQVTGIPVPALSVTPPSLLLTQVGMTATVRPSATLLASPTRTSGLPTFIPGRSTPTNKPPQPPTPQPTQAPSPAPTQVPPTQPPPTDVPPTQPPPPTDVPPPTEPPPPPTHEPPPTEPPPPPPTREPPPTAPP